MQPSPVSKAKEPCESGVCGCHVRLRLAPVEPLGEPGQPKTVSILLCENVPPPL